MDCMFMDILLLVICLIVIATFSCEPCKFSVTNVGYMQCGHQRLSTIKKSYDLFLHPPYQRENARKIIYKQSQ